MRNQVHAIGHVPHLGLAELAASSRSGSDMEGGDGGSTPNAPRLTLQALGTSVHEGRNGENGTDGERGADEDERAARVQPIAVRVFSSSIFFGLRRTGNLKPRPCEASLLSPPIQR